MSSSCFIHVHIDAIMTKKMLRISDLFEYVLQVSGKLFFFWDTSRYSVLIGYEGSIKYSYSFSINASRVVSSLI